MSRRKWNWVWLLFLAPIGAYGQAKVPAAPHTVQSAPVPYGNGEEQQISLPGAIPEHNIFLLGSDFTSSFNDNIRETQSGRISGTGFLFSPFVAFNREGGRVRVELSYQPTFLLYQHHSAYNEQDQNLAFDGSYRVTRRLSFEARTRDTYRMGLLQNLIATTVAPGLVGPGHLNDSLIEPVAKQFEDNSRIDVTYKMGQRSTVDLFATYMLRSFGRPSASQVNFLDTEGKSAGAQYVYQLTQDLSVGLLYLQENLHFGPDTRLGVENPAVSLGMRLSPHVSVYGFAGPEYTDLHDVVRMPYGPNVTFLFPVARTEWDWAAGGGVALRAGRTGVEASSSHSVTDGGGLLGAVTNSVARLSIDRQLGSRWSVQWTGGWERTVALPTATIQGRLHGEYGRIVLRHVLMEGMSVGVGYQYLRQVGAGAVPLGSAFHQNLVYLSFHYRVKRLPMGR